MAFVGNKLCPAIRKSACQEMSHSRRDNFVSLSMPKVDFYGNVFQLEFPWFHGKNLIHGNTIRANAVSFTIRVYVLLLNPWIT